MFFYAAFCSVVSVISKPTVSKLFSLRPTLHTWHICESLTKNKNTAGSTDVFSVKPERLNARYTNPGQGGDVFKVNGSWYLEAAVTPPSCSALKYSRYSTLEGAGIGQRPQRPSVIHSTHEVFRLNHTMRGEELDHRLQLLSCYVSTFGSALLLWLILAYCWLYWGISWYVDYYIPVWYWVGVHNLIGCWSRCMSVSILCP